MQKFELRRDRFDFFEKFENPSLNITLRLMVPNFYPFCEKHRLPPSHFFLFHIFKALFSIDNFRYRKVDGQVVKIDKIIPSYTVLNDDQLFNFTRFDYSPDLKTFIKRSVEAKEAVEKVRELTNIGREAEADMKDFVFVTCLPWLDFTSIQHPTFNFRDAYIPSIAWGKFKMLGNEIEMPFSIQAHHGFVDGYHMHLLCERIQQELKVTLQSSFA